MNQTMYGTMNGLIILFYSTPNDISSAAIATILVHRNCLRETLIIETTPLNYRTKFIERIIERISNNSLKSTFINTKEILK